MSDSGDMTLFSDAGRDWCEQSIRLARKHLIGQVDLFYWPERHKYQTDHRFPADEQFELVYEHIQLEMEGENETIFSVAFVAAGVTCLQPFQKFVYGTHISYRALCLLPDLVEALHLISVLQNHLNARLHVFGNPNYADVFNV